MFHVEHGFWNECYKIGAPNENHSHLGFFWNARFFIGQKKSARALELMRIFGMRVLE